MTIIGLKRTSQITVAKTMRRRKRRGADRTAKAGIRANPNRTVSRGNQSPLLLSRPRALGAYSVACSIFWEEDLNRSRGTTVWVRCRRKGGRRSD